MMQEERLQKVISRAGVASRRQAEELILAGKVKVNEQVVTELGVKVSSRDKVKVDGKLIRRENPVYLLFYKPKGVITTTKDERGRKTVLDYLPRVKERVYPVGRLDYNTEGLLVLTNDGHLTNKMIHPRYELKKVYRARIEGMATEEALDKLRVGVELEDGMTSPALVQKLEYEPMRDYTVIEITIHEGRNRQVRRMCDAAGMHVTRLRRIREGRLKLGDLPVGKWRYLTEEEVAMLKGQKET
jgi:23S rRNA pseudouridine2605 synthase